MWRARALLRVADLSMAAVAMLASMNSAVYAMHCPADDPGSNDCAAAATTAKNPMVPIIGAGAGAAAAIVLRKRRSQPRAPVADQKRQPDIGERPPEPDRQPPLTAQAETPFVADALQSDAGTPPPFEPDSLPKRPAKPIFTPDADAQPEPPPPDTSSKPTDLPESDDRPPDLPEIVPQPTPPELDPSERRKEEALRTTDLIDKFRDRLPAGESPIIDRILKRIDLGNPSDRDIDSLRRLTKALSNKIDGAEEFVKASAEAKEFNTYLRGAQVVATVGHGAASVLWGPFAPIVSAAVYGAAGTMNFDQTPGRFVGNALLGAGLGAGMSWGIGRFLGKFKDFELPGRLRGWEIPLTGSLGQFGTAAGLGAFGAWMSGDSPDDIKWAAGLAGLSAGVNYLAQDAVRAAALAKLYAKYNPTPGNPNDGQPILFGQRAVSPTFSGAGRLGGKSIKDVAEQLKNGTLDPADFPIQYIWVNGQKVVVNNRSLTTLTLAGKQPVDPKDMTGKLGRWGADSPQGVLGRLEEMNGTPSLSSFVRKTKAWDAPIDYEVKITP